MQRVNWGGNNIVVKTLLRKRHQGGNFYHGAAGFTGRKFCSEFFIIFLRYAQKFFGGANFGQK